MTTDDPAPGRSAFSTAPAPVDIPHASGPSSSTSAAGSTTTSARAEQIEYDANDGCPKKWLCKGDPSSRRSAVVPSARPPRSTSGPRSRQYRGCPSRQFRQDPHHGQPITTLSPTATLLTPAPTAATIPAPSCPSTPGAGNGISPSRAIASVWHTPLATTFTSASPGPGESTSTSATLKGVNSFSKIAAVARIVTDSLARGLIVDRCVHPGVHIGPPSPSSLAVGRNRSRNRSRISPRPRPRRRRRGSSRRVDRRPDRQPRVRHRPVGVVEQVHEGKEPVDLGPEVPVLDGHPGRPPAFRAP